MWKISPAKNVRLFCIWKRRQGYPPPGPLACVFYGFRYFTNVNIFLCKVLIILATAKLAVRRLYLVKRIMYKWTFIMFLTPVHTLSEYIPVLRHPTYDINLIYPWMQEIIAFIISVKLEQDKLATRKPTSVGVGVSLE